ncbi:MAG: trypsin-like peptidase domain-containing protein, partial [Clostridia bacterium]|nr:trypsin-like peptidase domain-containing protein [Clostridia bacterium]
MSKGAIIAIAVCAFLAVSVIFTLVGISIAGMMSITNGVIEENKVVMGDESIADIDSVMSSETEKSPENTEKAPETEGSTATITKTPGGSVVTVEGKVGELMSKHQVVALVKDSVVEITTEQVVNGHSFYQYVQSGAGSGVIIAKEGHVITNNHVIDGASKITVRLTNGNEYEAKLIGTDASSDIAILKINADEELTVATLGTSAKLSVAEEVIVIGNPLGELGGTVTNGIVSALAREINIDGEKMTLIQTNAAVNPGNSGGGMFNLYGELVGIVNAKSSGSDVEGLGFAIPIDTAYDIVLQLMDYGYVRGRVDHGLELIDIGDLFTAASYRVST